MKLIGLKKQIKMTVLKRRIMRSMPLDPDFRVSINELPATGIGSLVLILIGHRESQRG